MEHPATSADPLDGEGAGERAVRGSAIRSSGYVVGVLLSLIAVPLLGRQLGEGFGVYVTITALIGVVQGVSELGLTSVGIREYAQRAEEEREELLRDLLGARLTLTLVGIVAVFGFAFAAGYDATRLGGVAVACLGLVFTSLQAALVVPLAATLKQGRIAVADVVRQAVQVVLVVGLVVGDAGLVPLLAATVPAALAALVVTARGVPGGLPRPTLRPHRWLALLRDTLPFAAASAISVIYFRVTIIVTSVVASESDTTDFGFAFQILAVLINVPSLLVGALFPLLARAATGDPARMRMTLERTWTGSFALGGLVAVFVAAGAPIAILVIAGERPQGAVDALRIMGAGLGFSFVSSACQYGLLALRRHRDILLINVAALSVNVALTLALAGPYGAVGGAIALGVSEVMLAVVASVLLVRAGGIRLDGRTAARTLVAVAVGAAVTVALTPVGILAAAIVAPLVAFGVALALRALPEEFAALIPRRGAGR